MGTPAFLPPHLHNMADGDDRMVQQHPRPGIPHDETDFFLHVRLVAVYGAVAAKGLVVPMGTLGQTQFGVVQQGLAVRTQLPSFPVMVPAVDLNHTGYHPGFLPPFHE